VPGQVSQNRQAFQPSSTCFPQLSHVLLHHARQKRSKSRAGQVIGLRRLRVNRPWSSCWALPMHYRNLMMHRKARHRRVHSMSSSPRMLLSIATQSMGCLFCRRSPVSVGQLRTAAVPEFWSG
jgi:hypothetical protein